MVKGRAHARHDRSRSAESTESQPSRPRPEAQTCESGRIERTGSTRRSVGSVTRARRFQLRALTVIPSACVPYPSRRRTATGAGSRPGLRALRALRAAPSAPLDPIPHPWPEADSVGDADAGMTTTRVDRRSETRTST